MRRRRPRAVGWVLALVLMVCVGAAATHPGTAAAATPTVAVTISGLTPLAPTATDTLSLSGTVTNSSSDELDALNAYLRMSSIPLRSPDDLTQIADPNFRPGFRTQYFTTVTSALAPGATAGFTLEIPISDLGLGEEGVYVVGIEVRATAADGSRTTVGSSMTVLPYVPNPTAVGTVGVAWVWPLTAPVARDETGVFLDDALGAAMEPTGDLGAAFEAAGTTPVTWLVDPAVAEAAAAMSGGYTVRAGSTTLPGSHSTAAAAWLDRLRAAATDGRVILLPYGNVDAVALTRAGLSSDLSSALAARGGIERDLVPGAVDDVGLAPGGFLDAPTLETLGNAGITRVLVASTGLDTPTEPHATHATLHAGGDTFDAIRVETPAQPTGETSPIQQRQLLLAQTALTAITASRAASAATDDTIGATGTPSPSVSPAPRTTDSATAAEPAMLVLTPPAGQLSGSLVGSLLDVSTSAPWVRTASLADATAAPAVAGQLIYPASAHADELPASYLAQVVELRTQMDALAALTDSPSDDTVDLGATPTATSPASTTETPPTTPHGGAPMIGTAAARELMILRAESAAWRGDLVSAGSTVAAAISSLTTELGAVHIASTGSVTLSSSRGRFPLTVQNGLDQAITVTVDLKPQTTSRLRISDVPAVSIAAGQLATVDVDAQAGTNGTFVVDIQLRAPNGTPVGAPTALTVRATEYDTVAWIVIIVAAGLLFAAAGVRIVRRIIRARRA